MEWERRGERQGKERRERRRGEEDKEVGGEQRM